MIAVFDLDGTLCDNSTREHLALKATTADPWEKDAAWDKFHEGIPQDQPIWPVLHTLHALQGVGHTIEIWTARPARWRDLTLQWLKKHDVLVAPQRLLMRHDSDYRKAYIVKLEWFILSHATAKPNIVFEDHPETVRLLRLAGAVVAQVGEGNRN